MQWLLNVVQTILGLGAVVMLPIMIFCLGILFRMKLRTAIKSGLLVGIGFQGLILVIGLLMNTIAPVSEHYKALGSGFTTTDLGFATVGAASWTVPFAPLAVPLLILLNLAMLKLKLVRVINIDIWNFIHLLIPGAMAYALSGSFVVGLGCTLAFGAVTLLLADWIAPKWQSYFGLEGTTCSTFSHLALIYPGAILVNKIIDLIPGLNKFDVNMSKIQNRMGIVGEPAFVGLAVGVFLGIITRQPWEMCLGIGMGIAAVLILIPRMVSIMMEGLAPLGAAANEYVKKRFKQETELHVGMDVALGLGDPTVITSTVIVIPLVILMAFIIPNMSYFPIPMLGIVCYMAAPCVLASNGNLLRSLITTTFTMFYIVFFANLFVPEATQMMNATGMPVEGAVTDVFFGCNPGSIIVGLCYRLFGA